jgi:thymidylate synthase
MYDSIDELWQDALDITLDGQEVAPRGQTCFEQRGISFVLTDPTKNILRAPARKLSYHFMVAEWLWMLNGLDDVKTIAAYNKRIADYSDDGETFFGAYGPRFLRDLRHVINLLKRDPDSRQAVINIWRPEGLWQPTKDVPCTLTWQFFVRSGKLEMIASMRSNDVWLGMPYDIFNFTQIQRIIASALGVGVGPYQHNVGSLHLYETNEAAAASQLLNHVVDTKPSPEPIFPCPAQIGGILQWLPREELSTESAFQMLTVVPRPWQEYGSVLIHRFTKERSDLSFYFQELF